MEIDRENPTRTNFMLVKNKVCGGAVLGWSLVVLPKGSVWDLPVALVSYDTFGPGASQSKPANSGFGAQTPKPSPRKAHKL